MIETNHVLEQVSDYVLDLLPRSQRQQIEQHAATCSQCRQAIQRQSQVAAGVRSSLAGIPAPSPQLLHKRMPTFPTRRQLRWRLLWQRQLAPACLGLLILLGSWGLWQLDRDLVWGGSGREPLVATATMTDVPTATLAKIETLHAGTQFTGPATIVPTNDAIAATPAPNPTPIAAATQWADNE